MLPQSVYICHLRMCRLFIRCSQQQRNTCAFDQKHSACVNEFVKVKGTFNGSNLSFDIHYDALLFAGCFYWKARIFGLYKRVCGRSNAHFFSHDYMLMPHTPYHQNDCARKGRSVCSYIQFNLYIYGSIQLKLFYNVLFNLVERDSAAYLCMYVMLWQMMVSAEF